jgi:hypothetical protein
VQGGIHVEKPATAGSPAQAQAAAHHHRARTRRWTARWCSSAKCALRAHDGEGGLDHGRQRRSLTAATAAGVSVTSSAAASFVGGAARVVRICLESRVPPETRDATTCPACLAGALALAACDARTAATPPTAPAAHRAASDTRMRFRRIIAPAISPNTCACSPPMNSKAARPAVAGEDKTVAYIQSQFERIGLKPATRQLVQTVPMTETTRTKRGV